MKTKKFFQSVAYSARRNGDQLTNIAFVIWLIIATIIGYNGYGKWTQDSLPTEAKYQQYEKIVEQITEEGMHDVEVPKGVTIVIDQEEIEISNDEGHYAVRENYKEENINLKRDSGNGHRIFEKIFYGGFILGLVFCGGLGYFILYYILKLIYKIVEFLRKLKNDYDYKKRELEKEEKIKLEQKESSKKE